MSLASGGFEARIKFSHLACCLKFRDSGSPNSACTLRSSLLRLFSFFPYCLQLKEASGQFQHSAWKSISLNLQVHYETFYILCVCRQWICQLLCYHKIQVTLLSSLHCFPHRAVSYHCLCCLCSLCPFPSLSTNITCSQFCPPTILSFQYQILCHLLQTKNSISR